jgi:cytochrome b pre-mRNA-processing protein 3
MASWYSPKERQPMLAWLKSRRHLRQTARTFYGSIVAQARAAALYADWGVPDTVQGRFEMVVLHLVLALRRLAAAEGVADTPLARALTEAFVVDMDDTMREMTFGDLAVPREVKRATAALYDRHRAYLAALASPHDMSLAEAIASQMAYLDAAGRLDTPALGAYTRRAAAALDGQPSAEVLAGRLAWPHPIARL